MELLKEPEEQEGQSRSAEQNWTSWFHYRKVRRRVKKFECEEKGWSESGATALLRQVATSLTSPQPFAAARVVF